MPKPATMQAGSPDNFQTPVEALDCLIPYLKKEINNPHGDGARPSVIWEPACGKGNLVRAFEKYGYRVKGTDIIHDNRDFLSALPYEAYQYDYIVTNPPFSFKEKFFARCYNLGKPFALLMPISTFDSKRRRSLMAEFGVEIVLPPGRINFETPNHEKNVAAGKKTSAWFYTASFTHGLNIGKQLVFTDNL